MKPKNIDTIGVMAPAAVAKIQAGINVRRCRVVVNANIDLHDALTAVRIILFLSACGVLLKAWWLGTGKCVGHTQKSFVQIDVTT
jgi:hypothetical protein